MFELKINGYYMGSFKDEYKAVIYALRNKMTPKIIDINGVNVYVGK